MPEAISLDSIVSRKPDVLYSALDSEVLAFDVDSGATFLFEATARDIWDLLQTPISVRTLCERLREKFEVDERQCQDEVMVFLQRLGADGVVQFQSG